MNRVNVAMRSIVACALLGASHIQAAPAYVVIHPNLGACGMLDGNGNYFYVEQRPEPVLKEVLTQSLHDMTLFQCKMHVYPSAAGHAVKYDDKSTGMGCAIMVGVPYQTDVPPHMGVPVIQYTAYSWSEIVSADGEATLTCHARVD